MNTKITPHPHAALIAEWIKDTSRKVECSGGGLIWSEIAAPCWDPNLKYRFKPQPKPDVVKYYNAYPKAGWDTLEEAKKGAASEATGICKYVYDGETGLLKSVEKLD